MLTQKIVAKQTRASGFRTILTIFAMVQEVFGIPKKNAPNPTLQASPQALEKLLDDVSPLDPVLKSRFKNIFDRIELLVKLSSDQLTATKYKVKKNSVFDPGADFIGANTTQTFSPLELVGTAILVAFHMEKFTDNQLLDAVKKLRLHLRLKHKDLRLNAQCWGTVWRYINRIADEPPDEPRQNRASEEDDINALIAIPERTTRSQAAKISGREGSPPSAERIRTRNNRNVCESSSLSITRECSISTLGAIKPEVLLPNLMSPTTGGDSSGAASMVSTTSEDNITSELHPEAPHRRAPVDPRQILTNKEYWQEMAARERGEIPDLRSVSPVIPKFENSDGGAVPSLLLKATLSLPSREEIPVQPLQSTADGIQVKASIKSEEPNTSLSPVNKVKAEDIDSGTSNADLSPPEACNITPGPAQATKANVLNFSSAKASEFIPCSPCMGDETLGSKLDSQQSCAKVIIDISDDEDISHISNAVPNILNAPTRRIRTKVASHASSDRGDVILKTAKYENSFQGSAPSTPSETDSKKVPRPNKGNLLSELFSKSSNKDISKATSIASSGDRLQHSMLKIATNSPLNNKATRDSSITLSLGSKDPNIGYEEPQSSITGEDNGVPGTNKSSTDRASATVLLAVPSSGNEPQPKPKIVSRFKPKVPPRPPRPAEKPKEPPSVPADPRPAPSVPLSKRPHDGSSNPNHKRRKLKQFFVQSAGGLLQEAGFNPPKGPKAMRESGWKASSFKDIKGDKPTTTNNMEASSSSMQN
jgi:hypothetical protein